MKTLKGKVALITGVSRKKGIGFAIAKALTEKGADVFITSYKPYDKELWNEGNTHETEEIVEELGKTGVKAEALELDLSLPEAPKKLMEEVVKKFGKVDILINNACHSGKDTVETLDVTSLDKHYAVNTRATLLLTSEFFRQFTGEEGWVISMTSGQGVGPMSEEISYASTKGAIDAFTLSANLRFRSWASGYGLDDRRVENRSGEVLFSQENHRTKGCGSRNPFDFIGRRRGSIWTDNS